jgi:hypothetical protein
VVLPNVLKYFEVVARTLVAHRKVIYI